MEIIASYIESGNYRQVARKYNISPNTVKNYVQKNAGSAQICADKKREVAQSMLTFFDARTGKAQELIDLILTSSKEKIAGAPLRDQMGALKILSEVFGKGSSGRADSGVTEIIIQPEDASMESDDATDD